jgi:CheY-like chemotaxis protein
MDNPVGKTVLVIDDDRDIREVAKASLELVGGFTVMTAESGQRGVAVAQEVRPDAIILDLMMPEMDGQETLAQLKRDPGTACIPVIMLTAKVHARKRDLVDRGNAAGILLKPFDPMLLSRQVCEILGWSSSATEEGTGDSTTR